MQAASDAYAAFLRASLLPTRMLGLPADAIPCLGEAFAQAAAAHMPAMHARITGLDGVAQMHVDRVHADHPCEDRQMAVEWKRHLLRAESAKGPAGNLVGEGQPRVRTHVLEPMQAIGAKGRYEHHLGREAAVGAVVRNNYRVLGDDLAILGEAHFQPDAGWNARARGKKILEPAINEPHRAS